MRKKTVEKIIIIIGIVAIYSVAGAMVSRLAFELSEEITDNRRKIQKLKKKVEG